MDPKQKGLTIKSLLPSRFNSKEISPTSAINYGDFYREGAQAQG